MLRFKRFLCKKLGHKFEYYHLHTDPTKQIRVCRRCHIAQEYKEHLYTYIWSTLMWRTRKGAKDFFAGKPDCDIL